MLFYCTLNAYSQNTDIYNDILQKLTPQSPQASMMQRFGNYPVDYSTGVPNISVPLYTIKIGDFELPISIAYHASGIRVQDVATPVGLGWALNAGGCITKQVRGGKDDKEELYVRNHDEIQQKISTDFAQFQESYWHGLSAGEYDTQTDRYSYNVCGHSGIFRKNANTYAYQTFPYCNIKIEETPQKKFKGIYGNNVTSNGYKLTDDNGIEYYFDYVEFSCGDCTFGIKDYTPTAFYLTKIILTNKCDSVIFKYSEGFRYYVQNRQCIVDYGMTGVIEDGMNAEKMNMRARRTNNSTIRTNEIATTLLKSIEWNGNKVVFDYVADRQEYKKSMWSNGKLERLASVTVTNSSNKIIKTIYLDNDNYMGRTPYDKRMLLKSVKIRESGETYSFSYHTGNLPPYSLQGGKNEDLYCYEDYWGYYNGWKNWGNLPKAFIPRDKEIINDVDMIFGDAVERKPDEGCMKTGVLESVEYPTGGKTEFEFESNRLDDGTLWGGLRLRIKKEYDRGGHLINCSSFKYEMAAPSVSPDEFKKLYCYTRLYGYSYTTGNPVHSYGTQPLFKHWIMSGEPCIPLSADYGSPIYYYKVTERQSGNEGNVTMTEYRYENARTDDMGMLCYEDMDEFAWMQVQDFSRYGNFDYGNMSVVPTKITKYDNNDNIMYSRSDEFEDVLMDTVLLGVRLTPTYVYMNLNNGESFIRINWDSFKGGNNEKIEECKNYINETYFQTEVWGIPSYKRLSKRTESKDGITKTTSYAYDEQKRTLKPISEQINENQILTKYTFSYESNDAVSKGMQECNMIVPIKTNVYINGNLSRTDSVAYAQWYNGAYLPTDYYYSLGSGKLEKRCSCTYDKLNRLFSITKDNAASTMFVWLKKYDFPVAKIDGLTPEILKQKINIHLYDVFLSENVGNIDDIVRSNVDSNIYPVTTYKQEPLVGITRIISPTKASTTFKYDSMWRLNSIYDDKNFKISQYEYNYAK